MIWTRTKTAHLELMAICRKLGITNRRMVKFNGSESLSVLDSLIDDIKRKESKRMGFKSMQLSPRMPRL